ncbi:hypothetical protein JVT61DRAFT_1923 [Boletus reticuloceps]|uniref:Uncharacterized protein n=1 Tax=Boletus reticuloceps TaxID=495285 RepID=A0A8I2YBW7_9AGAM|nr:hypothetical protein JVT61DRAFT_1923 [Boletus reticuloceps]
MGSPWAAWDDMPPLVDPNVVSSQTPRSIPPPPNAAFMPSGPPPAQHPPVHSSTLGARHGHTRRTHTLHGASRMIPQLIHSNRALVHTSRVNPCAQRHDHTIILAEQTTIELPQEIEFLPYTLPMAVGGRRSLAFRNPV